MSLSLRVEAEMAAASFSTVLNNFVHQIGELERLSLLRGIGSNDENLRKELREFSLKIASLEDSCSELESYVDEEKASTAKALRIISTLSNQTDRARRIHSALSEAKTKEEIKPETETSSVPEVTENFTDSCQEGSETNADKENLDSKNVENNASSGKNDSISDDKRSETIGRNLRELEAPARESLQDVPKYMRSRLTHGQLLDVIKVFNETLYQKYTVLDMPRAKQGSTIRQKVELWRKHETAETRENSICFLSNDDIFAAAKEKKLDINITKTSLQVLRYYGLLRMNGEGGINRYVVV